MPLIVFPFAVPVRVSTLLLGDADSTLNWKWPVTLPLKVPPEAKDPLSVSPDTKQELEEIVRLATLSVPSLFSVIEVVKRSIRTIREYRGPIAVNVARVRIIGATSNEHQARRQQQRHCRVLHKISFPFRIYWKWTVLKMPT